MDDLISRKAAIDQAMGKLDYTDLIFDTATESEIVYMLRSLPSVPAVPLDNLCEWLGKFANPCKIGIRCYYPDDNDYDCMPTVECWRYVLTKWMEEQGERKL